LSLLQLYTGRARYYADHRQGPHILFVAVECRIGGLTNTFQALLDTAAQWCVLPSSVAQELGYDGDEADVLLSTRLGDFAGRLEQIPVSLEAREGVSLEIEATWLVTDQWEGPAVIGWKGCLERMRFALDPFTDDFYFAGCDVPPGP
jgi:hypothetical protein